MRILLLRTACAPNITLNGITRSIQFRAETALCSLNSVSDVFVRQKSGSSRRSYQVGLGLRPEDRELAFRIRLHSKRIPSGKARNAGRVSCVMEKMEISEKQILEEEQRIQQEKGELYLGKEETYEPADNVVDNSDKVPPEIRECWDLWQRVGLPVSKIAKQRNMTETGVFYCIFNCIQNDFFVDWYELCKEAEFTPDIAKRMIQSTEKLVAEAKGAPIEWPSLVKLRSSGVTEVHFGLYMTMLKCGFSYQTILNIASQKEDGQPVTDWGTPVTEDERFPTHITEAVMIQWLQEKDGASLLEIALKYRECDEGELMRLLLHLEKVGKIFRRQGIFRAI